MNLYGLKKKKKSITEMIKEEENKGDDACQPKLNRLIRTRKHIGEKIKLMRQKK